VPERKICEKQEGLELKRLMVRAVLIYTVYTLILTASVVYWSEFLATDQEVWVPFPALLDFLRSSGSGTGSTQSREYN
jgi:hypothetical protein